jgi:hypothetical protein
MTWRLLLVFSVAIAGCSPNARHQRHDGPAIVGTGGATAVPIYAIEFDDQGTMWDPSQLRGAIDAITALGNRHIVVITFIHGWKHNARSDDSNLVAFAAQLKERADLERDWAARVGAAPRPLLGVYVGWRGKSLSLDPWITENLTFWNRKAAAARVGSAPLTEAIFRIAKTTKEQNPDSQVLFIGHSFGGAVLETALAQAVVALLNQPAPADGSVRDFRSPVDLAVMVNPASSALATRQLIDTLMRREVYVRRQGPTGEAAAPEDKWGLPVMVSITASNDWATGWAFPLGQHPITWTKAFTEFPEGPGQRQLFAHTAGHTPFLYSHVLKSVPEGVDGPMIFHVGQGRHGRGYEIVRKDDAWNQSPYWIMQVPPDVVDGHNGIFTRASGNLLETILDASLLSEKAPAAETRLQANSGKAK